MAFIQIIEFHTDRINEARKHVDDYRAKTQGSRTAQRAILGRDRDTDGRYVNIVFFDSYDAAMQNSQLPETQELANHLASVSKGEPRFLNLEVEWDEA